ncbi:MAG TPA: DNA repair exonuclease [Candidatus Corynebacterium gallistercoris]|uniref:Nuclease SbcCD subunit D n=1 Tax=Candidatus Corynebacterium gallistercoris TaxID=2838530 RepID=A0A9D1RWP9_9CORY|nr:DNA repair exonuclease [Candidatus Corynebacterium gallistercoris]
MTRTHTARILHTSDWQLGMKRKFLSPEAQARFTEDRIKGVGTILRLAEERGCDAIVVAGDVFDSNLLDPSVQRRSVQQLATATVPVYLLPGNHDPLDAASVYHQPDIAELKHVTVLRDNHPHLVPGREDSPPLEIIGAPLRTKVEDHDVVGAAVDTLDAVADGRIRVLVGHGATSSFGDGDALDLIDLHRVEQACAERVVDYVALGDTHSAMPLTENNAAWYSGSHEVTDFLQPGGGGENNSGNVLIVDVTVDEDSPRDPARVTVEQVPVGTWRFHALAADMDSLADVEAFVARVNAMPDHSTTVVKYALTGTLSLEANAALEKAEEQIAPGFAALYRRERLMNLHVMADEEELATGPMSRGYVGMAVKELQAEAQGQGEQAEHARGAMRLLYRLMADVEA